MDYWLATANMAEAVHFRVMNTARTICVWCWREGMRRRAVAKSIAGADR